MNSSGKCLRVHIWHYVLVMIRTNEAKWKIDQYKKLMACHLRTQTHTGVHNATIIIWLFTVNTLNYQYSFTSFTYVSIKFKRWEKKSLWLYGIIYTFRVKCRWRYIPCKVLPPASEPRIVLQVYSHLHGILQFTQWIRI